MSFQFNVLGLARAAARRESAASDLPLLMYHRVGHGRNAAEACAAFEHELAYFEAQGYSVIGLNEAAAILKGTAPPRNRPCVALALDGSDASVFTHLFPAILKYAVPVTVFVRPSEISRSPEALSWGQIAEMVFYGLMDVRFHTQSEAHLGTDTECARWREDMELELGIAMEPVLHAEPKAHASEALAEALNIVPFGCTPAERKPAA